MNLIDDYLFEVWRVTLIKELLFVVGRLQRRKWQSQQVLFGAVKWSLLIRYTTRHYYWRHDSSLRLSVEFLIYYINAISDKIKLDMSNEYISANSELLMILYSNVGQLFIRQTFVKLKVFWLLVILWKFDSVFFWSKTTLNVDATSILYKI